MDFTAIVSFDSASAGYEIEAGELASNGNPGTCLSGGLGDPTSAILRVELPGPSIVTRTKIDWWKRHWEGQNLGVWVHLYDEDDNWLATPVSGPANGYFYTPVQTWSTADSGTISISNVKYAIFHVGASQGGGLEGRMDNCFIEYHPDGPPLPSHEGTPFWPIVAIGSRSKTTPTGISLQDGEKRLLETDLVLNSSPEPLVFSRIFQQNALDDTPFMGLGWSHNHVMLLEKVGGTPNRLIVQLPSGGKAKFSETTANSYVGEPGSNSTAAYNAVTNEYLLVAEDNSEFAFEATVANSTTVYRLYQRRWATGEVWTYSYENGSDRLVTVEDGFERRLTFSYYDSGSWEGQLERVTDSVGRYVEMQYVGSNNDLLLHEVSDVLMSGS